MRVREAARILGGSPEWLKRLERRGQIPPLPRDINGHHRLTEADVERLRSLLFGSPLLEDRPKTVGTTGVSR
jgi:DNA-binding transcriptional MerR regulator